MTTVFIPNSQAKAQADAKRTALANSVLKLFQWGFTPTADTVVSELDTNEANYTDYVVATITAWLAAAANIGGGWRITAPTSQFLCPTAQAVGNDIGGWWLEDSMGAVQLIAVYDAPVPMRNAGNSIQVTPTWAFPNGT